MNLKNLYTFKKIIETGNFQKAAEELNYAHSTVSFQIKQLEEELDIKLFQKNGCTMELTEDGSAILPVIDRILDSSDKVYAYANTQQNLPTTLTVGVVEAFAIYYLQTLLKDLKERMPNIKLIIREKNCQKIYDQVISGKLDIGIHFDVEKYPDNFFTRTLGSFPVALISSPKLNNEEKDFVTPNQKKNISHIRYQADSLELGIFTRYLAQKNIVLAPTIEVNSIALLKESIKNNLGVAIVPRFMVEAELTSGELEEIQTDINQELTAVYAYNKEKPIAEAMQIFLTLLEQTISNEKN